MEHVNLVVLWLNLRLQSRVVLLKFQELLWLNATSTPFLRQSLNFCTQNNDLEGKLIGELTLLLQILLYGLVGTLVTLDVPNEAHDMILCDMKNVRWVIRR